MVERLNGQPFLAAHADYGVKIARHTERAIKIKGGDGGFVPSTYTDAGATALIIGMTYGGAVVGYLLAHVLLAWIGGAS